jgi:hypothetical protein
VVRARALWLRFPDSSEDVNGSSPVARERCGSETRVFIVAKAWVWREALDGQEDS